METEEAVIDKIKNFLTPYRFEHTLRVAETAEKMALKTGSDPANARMAALLHDRAKSLSQDELISLARKSEWEIDEMEFVLCQTLHAPVSADLAKKEFDVYNREILEAIRFHTIGYPGMSRLAKIIYAADTIEPGRDFPGVELLRRKMSGPLDNLILAVCNHSIKYNINRGRLIHPNTLLLRNDLLGGGR